jgi:hypothetical protein
MAYCRPSLAARVHGRQRASRCGLAFIGYGSRNASCLRADESAQRYGGDIHRHHDACRATKAPPKGRQQTCPAYRHRATSPLYPVKPFAAHRDHRPPSTPSQRLKATLSGCPVMPATYGPPNRRSMRSSSGHGGPLRRMLTSSRAARCPFGNWSSESQRHAATIARTRFRQSRSSS